MIKIRGIPTGMFYSHMDNDNEAIELYDKNISLFREHRDNIFYQSKPNLFEEIGKFSFKYCLSDYFAEFVDNNSPIYFIIFSRHLLYDAIKEFCEKIPSVLITVIKETPTWVCKKEDAYDDINYILEYEKVDDAEEISIYLLKISVSDKYLKSAKFVAYYLTLVYLRLFCLGEPFVHFGVKYDKEKDGSLMEFAIKISNEKKTSRDRLIDIHSLTHKYDVEPNDLIYLGNIDKVNEIFPTFDKVIEEFKHYGDTRQTWQMKILRESRLGKLVPVIDKAKIIINKDNKDNKDMFDPNDYWKLERPRAVKIKEGDIVFIRKIYHNRYGVTNDAMIRGKVIDIREDDGDICIEVQDHKHKNYIGETYWVKSAHFFPIERNGLPIKPYVKREVKKQIIVGNDVNKIHLHDYVVPTINSHIRDMVYGNVEEINGNNYTVLIKNHVNKGYCNRYIVFQKYEIESLLEIKDMADVIDAGRFTPLKGMLVKGIKGNHYGVTNQDMKMAEIIGFTEDTIDIKIINHVNKDMINKEFTDLKRHFFRKIVRF